MTAIGIGGSSRCRPAARAKRLRPTQPRSRPSGGGRRRDGREGQLRRLPVRRSSLERGAGRSVYILQAPPPPQCNRNVGS
eukprot:scaffold3354_cov369-Prasinococcus_capsulatus_cf.AAC.6